MRTDSGNVRAYVCTQVAFGLLAGPLFPCIIALPQELGLGTTGISVSIVVSLANVGNLVGPFAYAELMRTTGTIALPVACLVAVVAMTAITLVTFSVHDSQRRHAHRLRARA